jgi:O-antigen/teichoic acid export membrane protein
METPETPNLARKTVQGTAWTYASFYGGKLMFFLSTVILARLLIKEDFGVAGYAIIVISSLDVLNGLGIGPALIYHREHPEAPNTAFWLGMGMGLALFTLTALVVAPLAGDFFNDPRAIEVTRILALTFPLYALANVHETLLRKQLNFQGKFIPEFTRATCKGLFSIILALLGFGYWSLIYGQIGGMAVSVIAYWWMVPWRPSFRFSPELGRALLSYGLSIVGVNILGVVLLNVDYLFVGRFLGAEALGVYTLSFRIPELLILQFCNVIAVVVFPVYAKMRDDPQALSKGFLTTMRYVSMITIPLGLGLALVARPFVLTVFTDKWVEAIPVMQAISIYAMFLSLAYNAGDVYKAQGRPGILTQMALVRAALLLPALFWAVTVPASITAVAWTQAAVAFIAGFANLYMAARLLKTSFHQVLVALAPATTGAALMSLAVMGTQALIHDAPVLIQLLAAVLSGALAYAAALWWLQRDLVIGAGHTLRTAFIRG